MNDLLKVLRRLEKQDLCSLLAIGDIAAERLRQIEGEGWSPQHDDGHSSGELSRAAACYLTTNHSQPPPGEEPTWWPWARQWWKPKSLHRNRVRAGALVIAELAKYYRSAPATNDESR